MGALGPIIDDRRVEEADIRRVVGDLGAAPALIVEAMRYSLLAGGKRLRPVLALAAADAVAARPGTHIPALRQLEVYRRSSDRWKRKSN